MDRTVGHKCALQYTFPQDYCSLLWSQSWRLLPYRLSQLRILPRCHQIGWRSFLILFGHHSKDHHLKREGLQALEMISCGG